MRERSAVVLSLVLLAAAVVAGLPAAHASDCGPGGVLCAGAATADITPPVTSPQFAYTFRHCVVTDAVDVAAHVGGVEGAPPITDDHLEEGIAWAASGGPPCLSNKLSPDTDGYAKTFPPSEGTFGRLLANAFVLSDRDGRKVAVVQADLGGIPGEVHEAVAKRLTAAGTGIGREHLMISATHTHGSVGGIFQYQGYALLGGDEFDPRIYEAVVAGITRAVLEADARLRPAKLAVGEGAIANANGNRRRSAWSLNPEAKLGLDVADAHRLLVIRVDTLDGVPLGIISNFTNHGVIHGTFDLYLSGDNQGTTTRLVSRAIRAEAEAAGVSFPEGWEVVDALTNGSAGDITPRSDLAGWSSEDYATYGRIEVPFRELARMEDAGLRQVPEALRVWRDLGDELTSDVTLDTRFDWVCFCGQDVPDDPHDPYDRGAWVPANDDPDYFGTSVQGILGYDDGTTLPKTVFPAHHKEAPRLMSAGATPNVTRIQLMRIGSLLLASMPGEPTIQMGRRIERTLQAAMGDRVDRVAVVGLANDYDSYMATIHEYEAYAYEGGFSLYGQQTGNLLKWRLLKLAEAMRDGAPAPACELDRECIPHPDTTAAALQPQPLAPDPVAGIATGQPSDIERLDGTRFDWLGGGPAAEWTPDDALVEVQRLVAGDWRTVATDIDFEVPVHYDKAHGQHRWTAYFDATADAAPGEYRFVVTGNRAVAPAQTEPYTLVSETFEIRPSARLTVARQSGSTFAVQNPKPDGAVNYRRRPKVSSTATVTGTLNGAPVTLGASFTLAPGDVLEIPAGGIADAWGNGNGAPLVVTG